MVLCPGLVLIPTLMERQDVVILPVACRQMEWRGSKTETGSLEVAAMLHVVRPRNAGTKLSHSYSKQPIFTNSGLRGAK